MKKFVSRYVAHQPDEEFYVNYSKQEHQIWQKLYQRQVEILPGRAVDEFIQGVKLLNLSASHVPQIPELNQQLKQCSDWQVVPVAAVISSKEFFSLLSHRNFPVATFIRRPEDLDYITEPDVFHEIFGHIPLLTQASYGDFIANYAKLALSFPEKDWNYFLRLFWFTIEFGLIERPEGLRIYGGGILSSYGETLSCLSSDACYRVMFEPVSVLRTPYRIDKIQPVYFVIKNFDVLHDIIHYNFTEILNRSKQLGMFEALYERDEVLDEHQKPMMC